MLSWPSRNPLTRIWAALVELHKELHDMSDALQTAIDQLRADVTQQTTVTQSAVTLIGGIPALIADAISHAQGAGATPEQLTALQDLHDQISAESASLAAAVSANTPDAGGVSPADPGATPPA